MDIRRMHFELNQNDILFMFMFDLKEKKKVKGKKLMGWPIKFETVVKAI